MFVSHWEDIIKLDHNLTLNPLYHALFLLLFLTPFEFFDFSLGHGEIPPFSPNFMDPFGRGADGCIHRAHCCLSYPGSHCVPMIDLFEYLNFTLYSFFE